MVRLIVCEQIQDCGLDARYLVLTDIEDYLGVNREVMVAEDIPNTLDALPVDLRMRNSEILFDGSIETFHLFSDGDQHHRYTVQSINSIIVLHSHRLT